MVPVLFGNKGGVDVGIHWAIRQISGHGHHVPKVGHKHAEGVHLERTTVGFSLLLGLLQICFDELDEPRNGLWFMKLAASMADHQSDVDVLDGLQLVI